MIRTEMDFYGGLDVMNQLLHRLKSHTGEVCVFGAKTAGREIVDMLAMNGKSVDCIVDNNSKLWGGTRFGILIEKPEDLVTKKSPLIVIAVNHYVDDILQQLLDMGIDKDSIFIPFKEWWLGSQTQYFDSEVVEPRAHEVFVDGGAFDGFDSRNCAAWTGNTYDSIVAFEPNYMNSGLLRKTEKEVSRMQVIQKSLWKEEEDLKFADNGASSMVCDERELVVPVTSLDVALKGEVPVTFLKMDIEGCELEALEGAEQLIRTYKPRLAICVYHKMDDIIEIPNKILELYDGYDFYLRHYSYFDTETVLYAIPK